MRGRAAEAAISLAAMAALLAACTNSSPSSKSATASTSSTRSSSSSTMAAGPCVSQTVAVRSPSGPVSTNPIWTIASGLNQPDDLLFNDGELYIGELGVGKIHVLTPGAGMQTLPVTIPKVEGMVFINGTLYVSDQQFDRVNVVQGSSVRTLLQLTPVAGQDGVDNISAAGRQLLVPDSPHGVVYWVDLAGHITRREPGFVRPTGAWSMPDGSVLVADEFGNAAYRIAPDGSRTALVRGLPIVDDIAADSNGRVFVVTPAVNAGRLAQLSGGVARDLVTGLLAPQGLVFDGADNIYLSESDAGRVDLVIRSFKLKPISSAHAAQSLCVDVTRAPGYRGAITLTGSGGVAVVRQPGTGDQGAVSIAGCSSLCAVTATAGQLVDRLAIPVS